MITDYDYPRPGGYHGNRNLPLTYNGKNAVSLVFSVTFNRIFVKFADDEDRHTISDEFEFGSGQSFHYGVIRP